jgi:hypothetical protein
MDSPSLTEASQFVTRFLLPFRFAGQRRDAARDALASSHWKQHAPHQNYRAEFHDEFCRRMFGTEENWNLYQLDLDQSRIKPGQEMLVQIKGRCIPAALWNQDGRDIELFLASDGIGVFSITLCPAAARRRERGSFSLNEIKTFNHALTQDSRGRRTPARLSKAQGAGYPALALKDLAEEMLAPVRKPEFGWQVQNSLAQLIPYTVVRLPRGVRFDSVANGDYAGQASLLAQVDEASHPLPARDDQGAELRIFHVDELFAVSCMGAAALLADLGSQADEQKLQTRLDTYFICFLASVMQRIRLRRLLETAGQVVDMASSEERQRRLADLRADMVITASRGDLIDVSARDSANRFLALCQQAQRVPQALALVQQTIADMDASFQADRQISSLDELRQTQQALHMVAVRQQVLVEQQNATLAQQSAHTRHMAATQTKVEWIEIFLISFYSAELVGLLGEQFRLDHAYISLWVLTAMFASGIVAALLLKPWDAGPEKRPRWMPPTSFIAAAAIVLLLVGAFLAGGRRFRRGKTELEELQHEVREMRETVRALGVSREAQPPAATKTGPELPASSPKQQ